MDCMVLGVQGDAAVRVCVGGTDKQAGARKRNKSGKGREETHTHTKRAI